MVSIARAVAALIALFFFGAQPALAKGPPTQVTMDGPGFEAPIAITNPDILQALSPGIIDNPTAKVGKGPGADGPRYRLIRSWGSVFSDQLFYHPGADGNSVILSTYPNSLSGATPTPARWFKPSDRAEEVLRQLVANPQSAADPPKTRWRVDPGFELPLLVVAVLLGAVVLARRRSASRAVSSQEQVTWRPAP